MPQNLGHFYLLMTIHFNVNLDIQFIKFNVELEKTSIWFDVHIFTLNVKQTKYLFLGKFDFPVSNLKLERWCTPAFLIAIYDLIFLKIQFVLPNRITIEISPYV